MRNCNSEFKHGSIALGVKQEYSERRMDKSWCFHKLWVNMLISIQTHDVTTFLMKQYASDDETDVSNVLMAQIISASIKYDAYIQHNSTFTGISWSPQPIFGVSPAPMINGSLLVGGSRGGSLVFIR